MRGSRSLAMSFILRENDAVLSLDQREPGPINRQQIRTSQASPRARAPHHISLAGAVQAERDHAQPLPMRQPFFQMLIRAAARRNESAQYTLTVGLLGAAWCCFLSWVF